MPTGTTKRNARRSVSAGQRVDEEVPTQHQRNKVSPDRELSRPDLDADHAEGEGYGQNDQEPPVGHFKEAEHQLL